jgi:hypothetical protein
MLQSVPPYVDTRAAVQSRLVFPTQGDHSIVGHAEGSPLAKD